MYLFTYLFMEISTVFDIMDFTDILLHCNVKCVDKIIAQCLQTHTHTHTHTHTQLFIYIYIFFFFFFFFYNIFFW